ncbi:alpha/beta hydrolase [Alkalicaulis satelles]|uniref:Alpha/beta hydrolase n=1 Tax=Alkalicaulis satelles TaxID=2609175 RepID=A0A5M6ZJN5_9PROT|nr:alpha/beta hydrolase [Alkalicaulis satelles]KAA5804999.1 alpha/beta hydrolase [Alkalicaulis satelles]
MARLALTERKTAIRTRDGRTLAGHVFTSARAPHAVMVINPAMGYTQGFYRPFARAAAARGWAALIYDYRGQGGSADRPPARDPARMLDWARHDIPAAAAHICALHPGLPLDVAGHGAGGQFAGLIAPRVRVRALALISSAGPYWGLHAPSMRALTWGFWRFYGPAALTVRGYVPRGAMWKGAPLPPGVWRDWRQCGVSRDGFRDLFAEHGLDARWRAFSAPVRAWTPDDDPIATPEGVRWLLERYERAPSDMKIVRRADLGRGRIGHDGLLREPMASVFWPQIFTWLTRRHARAAA